MPVKWHRPFKDRELTDPPNRKMKLAVAPLWRKAGVKITASMASAEATVHKKERVSKALRVYVPLLTLKSAASNAMERRD